jgi:hypothetical protein
MRTISVRLDDRTDAVLTTYCERHGMTQTDAVKAAIEHLTQTGRPTPAELAEQLGLIGGFSSDGSSDLAAKHSQRVKERLRAKLARESVPAPAKIAPRRSPAR